MFVVFMNVGAKVSVVWIWSTGRFVDVIIVITLECGSRNETQRYVIFMNIWAKVCGVSKLNPVVVLECGSRNEAHAKHIKNNWCRINIVTIAWKFKSEHFLFSYWKRESRLFHIFIIPYMCFLLQVGVFMTVCWTTLMCIQREIMFLCKYYDYISQNKIYIFLG